MQGSRTKANGCRAVTGRLAATLKLTVGTDMIGGVRQPAVRGAVAQLVEQRPFKPWVPGSSPGRLTTPFPSRTRLGASFRKN